MTQKIEKDLKRFRDIVKKNVRKDLKKFLTKGEMITRKGNDKISIPLPQIQLPRFRYGSQNKGGVGQGEGKVGDSVGNGQDKKPGQGEAGEAPGEHVLEVDVELSELAEMLGEELQLPNIEKKGKKTINSTKDKYSSLRNNGPESLRQFKKTYINSLKRQIASGTYNPDDPIILPERQDRRYRSWKEVNQPETNAVIGLMMDVSGSMGEEQKEFVRLTSFWLETWLKSQFDNIEIFYVIHDAVAREVDSSTFYRTRESGGTKISSAYKLFLEIVKKRYQPSEWNIYPFHFSDGDNWSGSDTEESLKLVRDEIIPISNLFSYGQVRSLYGSGQFIKDLRGNFGSEDKVALADIETREDIYDAIKTFLGKGK